jgi:hypothetical protein
MVGEGQGDDCVTTSSDQEFVAELLPGDILLFDGSQTASAVIKFADNSPVNHCAIFAGGENFAHVTHHEQGKDAIQFVNIYTRLRERSDYNVTALRHASADPEAGAPAALEVMAAFLGGETSYAYLNLLALFVPAFLRAYHPQRQPDQFGSRPIEWAEQAFLRSMDFDNEWRDVFTMSPRSKSLTCSQFVYLCFAAASPPLPVDIREPLARYRHRDMPTVRGYDPNRAGMPEMLDLEFHPGLVEDPRPADTAGVVIRGGSPHVKKDLSMAARELARRIVSRSWTFGHEIPPRVGDVVPELVTPKDLWSSESLASPAMLVRAPAEVLRGRPEKKAPSS